MSKNFVSDPHSVVKSGDVVRVKVLSVDVPRHRISLTLRLDDDGPRQAGGRDRPGPKNPSSRSGRTGAGSSGRPSSRAPGDDRKGEALPDGALADALRRAGLDPKTPKPPKSRDDRPGRR
jgi:uncharacterized protein